MRCISFAPHRRLIKSLYFVYSYNYKSIYWNKKKFGFGWHIEADTTLRYKMAESNYNRVFDTPNYKNQRVSQ